jgi:phosphonatase-like hydrolase
MFKMVVFDMAGTTINEDNLVYKTLRKVINERGFDFSLEQVLAEGAGKEKLQAIKSILRVYANSHNESFALEIFEQFMVELHDAYETYPIKPEPNAEELFVSLRKRNILVALNTGYDRQTAESLLEKINWKKGREYDFLITASDVKNNRPKPDMILLAMQQSGINDAAEVIKVGDSIIDVQEGQNAGCGLNIGITTGAHTFEQLQSAKPDHIIQNLMELVPILDKHVVHV